MSLRDGIEESLPDGDSTAERWRKLSLLSLTSLGVVFGDIGTSPLYAVRECFFGSYGVEASRANVLGVLSLIAWSLIVVISVKYLMFVLRADNGGEGGILALMELVRRPFTGRARRALMAVGLFGAALLYGDGMITPAISVLSAVEGLEVATPVLSRYVIPLTLAILIALFALQQVGTAGVGKLFGPIMITWFAVLAVSGTTAIARYPSVLAAMDPLHGFAFLRDNGNAGFTILGIVFLVVTGGEALYADIGHFGVLPIRVGWYGVALPSLMLNYFGQGATILARDAEITNPFYQMVPAWGLYPLVVLATCATVIASQAIISGAFSLTFQGVQLGYLPRLEIRHTSPEQRGQIYIPAVNWILLLATVGLVLGFRRSGNLASAYGVAITTTMVITSLLYFVALRTMFGWSLRSSLALTGVFLVVDLAFFAANMGKFFDGGWVPLLVAGGVFLLMLTWRRGAATEQRKRRNRIDSVRRFLADIGGGGAYRRVPGQAVYLARNARGTPHSLRHNLKHNRALHQTVVIYTVSVLKSPRVDGDKHFRIKHLRTDITRVIAYYGFMETPNVPADLAKLNARGVIAIDLDRVTYFVGDETLLPDGARGMSGWRSSLYALMARNEARATRFFHLPPEQVFEIGSQIPV